MNSVWEYFTKLYREKSQVTLLTWAYGIISVVVVLVAGLIALINQSVGVAVLIVPLISISALCANIFVWAFVRFILDTHNIREETRKRIAAKEARAAKRAVAAKSSSNSTKK